jgi:hypothetical protein
MQIVNRLAHPGWVGVVLPILLAVGATFSPDAIRGLLLLSAIVAATWTFHKTGYAGQSFKKTGVAFAVFLFIAIGIFTGGHILDVRSRALAPAQNKETAHPMPVSNSSQGAEKSEPASKASPSSSRPKRTPRVLMSSTH